MKLKEWLETVGYRITEGSDWGWNCFGNRTYTLSYWNGDHDGHSMNVVFDTDTQDIYIAEVCDYTGSRAYRWIDPQHRQAYQDEVKSRAVDDCAWDTVEWIDLEVFEDWKTKAEAIRDGLPYDLRVSVPLEIPDDDLLKYMIAAHNRDMTFNQFVEEALKEAIAMAKLDEMAESHHD